MPVYEYECKSCKKTYEIMQKFDDPPLNTCEICGGEVKKLISNTTFVLKGSGWYITDYARKSEEKTDTTKTSEDSTKDTKVESKSNGSSSETKSETSTETKSETKVETTVAKSK
ncbi:MAG: zinc ribbon domain-containing protein [Thermodesulfovibrionales bacterium]|nr:zinc ribbon domain-containing protein [Thermodesulfovibrionales bacterium]